MSEEKKDKKSNSFLRATIGVVSFIAGIGIAATAVVMSINPDDRKEIKEALRKKMKDSVINKINPLKP